VTPILVAPNASLGEVLGLMQDSGDGSVLVVQNEKLVGIFTERDALRLMASTLNLDQPISEHMIRDVVSVRCNDTVQTAITEMALGGYRRLPVLDEQQRPVGLLRVDNLLHYLVEHVPSVIYNLPPAPHHATVEREGA
jgi:CBS domain-containing protein